MNKLDIYFVIAHLIVPVVMLLIPGLVINRKFLNNMKHEQKKEAGKTVQRIMKNNSIAQMFFVLALN